jgi:hypothetical protein
MTQPEVGGASVTTAVGRGDERGRLVIRGTPGLRRIVGAGLVAGGVYCLAVALPMPGMAKVYPLMSRIAVGSLGGIAALAGGWVVWRAQRSAVMVDRATRTVTLVRRGLFHTTAVHYQGSAVADVRVTKERDGKGAPVYRVEMVLDTGTVVVVPLFRPHDRTRCMQAAERLWAVLGLPKA